MVRYLFVYLQTNIVDAANGHRNYDRRSLYSKNRGVKTLFCCISYDFVPTAILLPNSVRLLIYPFKMFSALRICSAVGGRMPSSV